MFVDEAKGIHACRVDMVALFPCPEVIIGIEGSQFVPAIFIDQLSSFGGFSPVFHGGRVVLVHQFCLGDSHFQVIKQGVQVHRYHIGRTDGRQAFAIGKPSAAEVDAALRRSTEVFVHFNLIPSRFNGGLYIFFVTLLPWYITVIPIPIQDRSVFQFHRNRRLR